MGMILDSQEIETYVGLFEEMYEKAEDNASLGLWQTKDGDWLHVTEMGSQHIKNCIRMLERNNSPFADIYIPMFKKELERREENKQWCYVDDRDAIDELEDLNRAEHRE